LSNLIIVGSSRDPPGGLTAQGISLSKCKGVSKKQKYKKSYAAGSWFQKIIPEYNGKHLK
jgi:hypothetical protein